MSSSRVTLPFPWISLACCLLLIGYFFIIVDPRLLSFYNIPAVLVKRDYQAFALLGLLAISLLDIRSFNRRRHQAEELNARMCEQVAELLKNKKALQSKVHTYSGHADKLKMFISDRLLEYIEYDEKFLHFRSIASEVRHNGVISYDKVKTALLSARQHNPGQATDYDDALNSMNYLWDLLDLSTTDNIAMHVADYLCECEEHYFQQHFESDAAEFDASYTARDAVMRALDSLLESPPEPSTEAEKEAALSGTYLNEHDSRFWIQLEAVGELLGKDNYLVLLVENLINNALFYASQRAYSKRHARVSVQLEEIEGNIRVSVYNRGPHISPEDEDKIYQLGYSTRRVNAQHGRGLGLYFVHQLVRGYEGSIRFCNIDNRQDVYTLRIVLANGDIVSEILQLSFHDDKPQLFVGTDETPVSTFECRFQQRVSSVEVTQQASKLTQLFQEFDTSGDNCIFDNSDRALPRWVLNVNFLKRNCKLEFLPLNVSGVKFVVDLPSAQSRLDGDSNTIDIGQDEIDALGKKFSLGRQGF